jgi:hypothetical protein
MFIDYLSGTKILEKTGFSSVRQEKTHRKLIFLPKKDRKFLFIQTKAVPLQAVLLCFCINMPVVQNTGRRVNNY